MSPDDTKGLQKLGFGRRCVAFLDFLGFRDLVQEIESSPPRAQALLEHLKAPRQLHEHLAPHFQRQGEEPLQVTGFSDSIVISSSHPYIVTHIASSFYAAALCNGLYIRGGIAVGTLFHTQDLVLGSAMIRAYEIESEIARVPRVVLDQEVIESAEALPNPNGGNIRQLLERSLVSRDSDELWILDPFSKDSNLGGVAPNWLSQARSLAEAAYARAKASDRTCLIEKYDWLLAKMNGVAARKGA